jgi:hypothetical protein
MALPHARAAQHHHPCAGRGPSPTEKFVADAKCSSDSASLHPGYGLVGVGQRGALDDRTKDHRVQLARVCRQARFDIAQALAPRQLRERHRSELLGTRQRADARVARVAIHDAREARPRHEIHDLREKCLASLHVHPPRKLSRRAYAASGNRRSSRHQTKTAQRSRPYLLSGTEDVI